MTPLGVKICGESEFDIFETKKNDCLIQGRRIVYWSEKSKKCDFRLQTTKKMCGESEFDIYKIPRIQEKLYIDAKIRGNNIFTHKRGRF